MASIVNLATKLKIATDDNNIYLYDKDIIQIYGENGNFVVAPKSLDRSIPKLLSIPLAQIRPTPTSLSDLCETVQGYLDNIGSSSVSELPLSIQLSTNGDGTGTTNAAADYSITAGTFYYQPAAGEVVDVHSIQYYIQDSGLFPMDGYGAIAKGTVTNGYDIEVIISDVIYKINNSIKVTSNGDLFRLAAHAKYTTDATASAHNSLIADSDMKKRFGNIILHGDNSDMIRIVLNDAFNGLIKHQFRVTGHYL